MLPSQRLLVVIAGFAAVGSSLHADEWVHPAGPLDVATLDDMKRKCESLDWARKVVEGLNRDVQPWLVQPRERLDELLPRRRMSVYWLMVCPECRGGLRFDPFNNKQAACLRCGKTADLDQRSPASNENYGGTLYEGWGCSYLLTMAGMAKKMALLHALGADRSYAEQAAVILKILANRIKPLPVLGSGTQTVIWTYNKEGDAGIVINLATTYELLRNIEGLFSADDQRAIQVDLLKHWADSVFRVERDSSPRSNQMFEYLSAVALVGCVIEDADYVDWAFGHREYSPENRPDHHSLGWLTNNQYREDGGFLGLCSAYHLYALGPDCRVLVFGHRLAQQMPALFPPEIYDELDPLNPRSRNLRRAVKWFTAQAFPDLTMAPFGDMGGRISLMTYPLTAEIGYRYLGIGEVGSYRRLRTGDRGMAGLVYGVDIIKERSVPYQSTNLSSGYVALKREANGNRLYAGLNALAPGSGHQHADRLNLLTYSRDRMLTGERWIQYHDAEQRIYAGASYAHNTVTVDETSQMRGNLLTGERAARINIFVDLPAGQVAEAHGDKIYEQTSIYRRLICQFDEYLLDIFRVQGGDVHDWFYHGVGEGPVVSIPLETKPGFEPALYVVRGKEEYKSGAADETFSATWRIPADPSSEFSGRRRHVHSRVTMAGAPGQTAFILNTFPTHGQHSLMVRQAEKPAPFIAIHEAYFAKPIATGVRLMPTDSAAAIDITHADGSKRLAVCESGSGPGGLRLKGRFAVIEFDPRNRLRSLLLVHGTELSHGGLQLQADRAVSLSVTIDARGGQLVSAPRLGYETVEGQAVYGSGRQNTVSITVPEQWSPTGKVIRKHVLIPGQTKAGPSPVEVRW